MDESACTQDDDKLFFPNGLTKGGDALEAKRICAACPVFAECHQFTADGPTPSHGVWAGVDYRKRRDGSIWN